MGMGLDRYKGLSCHIKAKWGGGGRTNGIESFFLATIHKLTQYHAQTEENGTNPGGFCFRFAKILQESQQHDSKREHRPV